MMNKGFRILGFLFLAESLGFVFVFLVVFDVAIKDMITLVVLHASAFGVGVTLIVVGTFVLMADPTAGKVNSESVEALVLNNNHLMSGQKRGLYFADMLDESGFHQRTYGKSLKWLKDHILHVGLADDSLRNLSLLVVVGSSEVRSVLEDIEAGGERRRENIE